jgi:hypothetical protein
VNNPPVSGPNSGNSSDVEVILQRNQTPLIAAWFKISKVSVTVRAVAGLVSNGNTCLLTLGGDLSMGGQQRYDGAQLHARVECQ